MPNFFMEDSSPYQNTAVKIIEIYDSSPSKADEILSEHFFASINKRPFRGICQFIFLTVLRNKFLIEHTIQLLAKKKPKFKMQCLLKAAIAEVIIAEDDKKPKVIDSWVGWTKKNFSKGEANFVNAVLRRCSEAIEKTKRSEELSVIYSIPNWLIERWKKFFGSSKTDGILEILNKPSEVFFRMSPDSAAARVFENYTQFFSPSKFENFYRLNSGNWKNASPLLETGYFYIQDPSTYFAPNQLKPRAGGKYLDLCASPGGKSRIIADLIKNDFLQNREKYGAETLGESLLVSVDFGNRIQRLKENMEKVDFMDCKVADCNLLKEDLKQKLEAAGLPTAFDGVFIDAPCSNTGVLRRRPDARYRIRESDISNCAEIQRKLLEKYAGYVKSGGTLVFSTCSIDEEENAQNAEYFSKNNPDWTITVSKTILPDEENDGCGFFAAVRK